MTSRKSAQLRVMEHPPGYDDPADLFLRHPNPGEAWEKMIREAKPAVSWMISKLDARYDLESPTGASDACYDMVDMLLRHPPVARARYVRELAAKIGEDERTVRQTLNEIVKERGDYYAAHPEDVPVIEQPKSLEELLDLS